MSFNQKKLSFIKMYIIVIIIIFFVFSLPAQNLILNPGCEDTLINGKIPHWTEIVGNNWTQRTAGPDPYEGYAYFFPGVAALAELQQDIDVSSYASSIDNHELEFQFEGYVRAWNQSPADLSRIQLEFLDMPKTSKLDTFDSGNYSDVSEWVQVTDTTLAPAGTRHVRIRLISTRRAGSNNDGYYDDLSLLTATPVKINDKEKILPGTPRLEQNYPNPFNPTTKISYSTTNPDFVNLKIFNTTGQEIQTLVNKYQRAGDYTVNFNAYSLSSGIYFYKLRVGKSFIQTKKMILMR